MIQILSNPYTPGSMHLGISDTLTEKILFEAIEKNYINLTRIILATDPYFLYSQDLFRRTPLHVAVEKEHTTIIHIIIDTIIEQAQKNNQDVITAIAHFINIQDRYKQTPLHIAVSFRRQSLIQLLLKLGARLDIKDCGKKTALQRAQDVASSYPRLLAAFTHNSN